LIEIWVEYSVDSGIFHTGGRVYWDRKSPTVQVCYKDLTVGISTAPYQNPVLPDIAVQKPGTETERTEKYLRRIS